MPVLVNRLQTQWLITLLNFVLELRLVLVTALQTHVRYAMNGEFCGYYDYACTCCQCSPPFVGDGVR